MRARRDDLTVEISCFARSFLRDDRGDTREHDDVTASVCGRTACFTGPHAPR
ncbi:Hypothetical protein A7982_05097 [Minicystis rosea]|nr:Hypothetical protein A7982_05097 [Minicystis rosea]